MMQPAPDYALGETEWSLDYYIFKSVTFVRVYETVIRPGLTRV